MILKLAKQDMSNQRTFNHLIDINSGEIVEFVDKDIESYKMKLLKNLDINLLTINLFYMVKNKKINCQKKFLLKQ